jgi:methanogenic corrinoid protein MtbC1
MGEDLVNALADLKEEEALRITQERLNAEEDPLEILEDATRAMEIVGYYEKSVK